MGEKLVVDHCCLVAIAPYRMSRPGCRVFDHANLETLFKEFAQMRLDTHIGKHAAEHNLVNLTFPQLQG
jgi:hypothetical protein